MPRFGPALSLLAVALTPGWSVGPPLPTTTLRYLRPAGGKWALESRVTEVKGKTGLTYTSLTDRGREKMTLTVRFDATGQARDAKAMRETPAGRQSVAVVFGKDGATLTRQGKTERLAAATGVVVTTAPDWSDIFWVIRRYDRAKGGEQKFAGLWIHPVQDTRQLTFTVKPEKEERVEVGGRALALTRYRVVLRSGAYLVWADSQGRVCRLMPPGRPGSAVVLEGLERATASLR